MIKLSKLSILILLVTPFTSQAQRKIDVKPIILNIKYGHVFYSPGDDSIAMAVVNLGPDTILPSDQYYFEYRFGGVILFPKFHSVGKKVSPGDSFFTLRKVELDWKGNVDSMKFCAEVKMYTTGTIDTIDKEKGAQLENNKVCLITTHRDTSSNNSAIEFVRALSGMKIYPNPSNNGIFNVESLSVTPTIRVFSIDGKEQKTIRFGSRDQDRVYTFQIDNAVAGMYVLQLTSSNQTFYSKLVVR